MTQSHNGRAFRWVQIHSTQAQFEPSVSTQAQFDVSIGFKIMTIWLRLQSSENQESLTELKFIDRIPN